MIVCTYLSMYLHIQMDACTHLHTHTHVIVMYMWLMYSIISQGIIADSGLKTG